MRASVLVTLWQGARHLLMPGVCLGCHELLPPDRNDFCIGCQGLFAEDPRPTCPRCSSTVGPHGDLTGGCGHCRGQSFAFFAAVRLGRYEGDLRNLVLRMKQPGSEGLAEAVGENWAIALEGRVRALHPNVVVPVPLHWTRRWRRGFNQSELLARAWTRRLGLPYRPRWLKRIRNTPAQSSLPTSARRDNMKSAFRAIVRAELKGQTVLLVDDVLTTGSTAHEAAKALREAGASSVIVAVLAHGH